MVKRRDGERQLQMVVGRAAKLLRKAFLDKIKRRRWLAPGYKSAPVFGDQFVFVAVRDRKVQGDSARFRDGAGGLDGLEEIILGPGA